jgi:hypothetical protein
LVELLQVNTGHFGAPEEVGSARICAVVSRIRGLPALAREMLIDSRQASSYFGAKWRGLARRRSYRRRENAVR